MYTHTHTYIYVYMYTYMYALLILSTPTYPMLLGCDILSPKLGYHLAVNYAVYNCTVY